MSYQAEQIESLRISINREFPKLYETLKEHTNEIKNQNILKLIELDVFTNEEKKDLLTEMSNQYKSKTKIKKR